MIIIKFFLISLFIFSCSTSDFRLASTESMSPEERFWDAPRLQDDLYRSSIKLKKLKDRKKNVQGVCLISNEQGSFKEFCRGIELYLENEQKEIVSSIETDSNGVFEFEKVPSGRYLLKVNSLRYKKSSNFIFVSPGAEVLIRLKLKEKS